jgi:DNA-binding MarR family transcriptional regulator
MSAPARSRALSDRPWYEDVPIPQLMRVARDVYRDAVRRALEGAGCDDIPRNGTFVLSSLDRTAPRPSFSPQAEVVASLGLSKQAASQLIDTLVLRAYLERRNDPEDRRRMGIRLTDRGLMAAIAIQGAFEVVEAEVTQMITADELHGLRAGLAAYRTIREGPAVVHDHRPGTTAARAGGRSR